MESRSTSQRRVTTQQPVHTGGGETTNGIIPSIERVQACDAKTVGHEALGHSMWGHPNGSADGNGIGLQDLIDSIRRKFKPDGSPTGSAYHRTVYKFYAAKWRAEAKRLARI